MFSLVVPFWFYEMLKRDMLKHLPCEPPAGHEVARLRLVSSGSRRRAAVPRPLRDDPRQRAGEPDPAGAPHDDGPALPPAAGGRHELPPAALPAEQPAVPTHAGPSRSAGPAQRGRAAVAHRESSQPRGRCLLVPSFSSSTLGKRRKKTPLTFDLCDQGTVEGPSRRNSHMASPHPAAGEELQPVCGRDGRLLVRGGWGGPERRPQPGQARRQHPQQVAGCCCHQTLLRLLLIM